MGRTGLLRGDGCRSSSESKEFLCFVEDIESAELRVTTSTAF